MTIFLRFNVCIHMPCETKKIHETEYVCACVCMESIHRKNIVISDSNTVSCCPGLVTEAESNPASGASTRDSLPTGLIHLITCPLLKRLPRNSLNRDALLIRCDDIIPAVNVAYFFPFFQKTITTLVGRFKGENPCWLWSRRRSLDVTEIISSLFPGKRA